MKIIFAPGHYVVCLSKTETGLILVDNGNGDKQDAKFFSHYYLHGDDTLEKSLLNMVSIKMILPMYYLRIFILIIVVEVLYAKEKNWFLPLRMPLTGAIKNIGTGL